MENRQWQSDSGSFGTPRGGIVGIWDRLVGPNATATEQGLVLVSALVFATGVLVDSVVRTPEWTLVQRVVVFALALDIAGGIVANTTVSGARWWHRPSQRQRDHLAFVAAHVYPFALAFLFTSVSWGEASLVYGYLLLSAGVVLASPQRLRRPIAMILTASGILLAVLYTQLGPGLEWFTPFLYIKILGGHLAVDV